ncbi:arginase family protein [Hyphococcus flavus]|uniref:Arginase family protein n=1 Tax=Hyphococcus flavus TaxID=1866326 RepID=A0AAE9ZDJ9_9PROT|nr:arginase family protein [Hyphococcus flavus]WDI32809.1 arginase family protein [Hyphococcus flavus]
MQNVAALAEDVAKEFNLNLKHFGSPENARRVGWQEALDMARPLFRQAQELFTDAYKSGLKPALITSRCATSIATLPVVMAHHPEAVVLWFDAHGDLNTPMTSQTSYLGGMPLAGALGLWDTGYGAGVTQDSLIHIGGRDFDGEELELLTKEHIHALRFENVAGDLDKLRHFISGKKVFVHLDTDVFDPSQLVAEYAVPDGLLAEDVATISEVIATSSELIGLEITECSPKTHAEREMSHKTILKALAPLKPVISDSNS